MVIGKTWLLLTVSALLATTAGAEQPITAAARADKQAALDAARPAGLRASELADKQAARTRHPGETLLDYKQRLGEVITRAEKLKEDAETPATPKGPGNHTDEGGPDAFGNSWIMTGDEGGPAYAWVDVPEGDRTYLTLTDDGVSGAIDLGGSLSFYGTSYSQGFIGSNGMLGFTNASLNVYTNVAIPSAALPNNRLCVFWDDLYPPDGGQVFYGVVNGDFVATWNGISRLSGEGTITVQIVLDFDNTAVYYNYAGFDGGVAVNSCTVGIEGPDGTDGLGVLFDGAPFEPTAQTTIRFDLAPPPQYAMSISPEAVALTGGPGDELATQFTLFNAGLTADSYTLTTANDIIDFATFIDGQPATTVGPLAPGASAVIDVVGSVPDNQPSGTDQASVLVESAGSDNEETFGIGTTVFNAGFGGPDTFGNTWTSSAGGDVDYAWVEIPQQDRTVVTLTDDSFAGPFAMGGVISFYGIPYSQVYIGSNGNLAFDSNSLASLGNVAIPNAFAPNAIMPFFWDDLNPGTGGQVYYGTVDGDFVVTFDAVREYGGTGTLTAQVVFDFDNSYVYYNYAAMVAPLDVTSCTIGIENETGTDGLQVISDNNPGSPMAEWTVRFALGDPPDYWPLLQDGVAAMGAADSQVTVDMDVMNIGLLQDSFTITATADNGVEVDVLVNGQPGSQTPVIQPNSSFTFGLELTIPEVPGGPNATVTVTATSVGDAGQTDQTTAALTIVLVQGGPDAGGYFWSTSDAGGAVEYEWVTIENPVQVTGLADDNSVGPFDIGFPWTHYGNTYTQVHIASNGSIGFSPTGMNSLGNTTYPSAATPNDMISFFWDDLNPGSAGTVSYGTQDGMFIVEFNGVVEFGGTGTLTAQVILDSNEGAVRINYQSLVPPLDILGCTIGQENVDGTMGLAACYDGDGWLPHDAGSIWFGPNVIGPSGPYAVRVTPDDVSGVGITGGFAEYEFEVENRGENPSAFTLTSEGNAWDVTYHSVDNQWIEITSIPEVGFDETYNLGVRVHVPAEPESFTDLLHFTVTSTEDETAFDDAQILTASSCSHTSQLTQNVSGNGLFGTEHLMDGDWVSGENIVWSATGVNRMVMENTTTGAVGTISVLPFGHDYMGIAHDSRDGSFWVSYIGGVSHVSATGALIAAFSPPLLDAATGRVPTGLAYDADTQILWVMCANGAVDEFVRIDIESAASPVGLGATTVPWSAGVGSGAAGLDYNEGTDQLVALHTGTGTIECFLDLGDGTVDARGDFCPSGLVDAHGVALHEDGRLFVGWTSGLAHPVEEYTAPCAVTAQDREALQLPTEYELGANFPNPFNPSTVIRYALPGQGMVRMDVYNLIGQHQQTLVSGLRPAGYHEVVFDAGSRSSGVYFYRLTVTDLQGHTLFSDAGKMILMK